MKNEWHFCMIIAFFYKNNHTDTYITHVVIVQIIICSRVYITIRLVLAYHAMGYGLCLLYCTHIHVLMMICSCTIWPMGTGGRLERCQMPGNGLMVSSSFWRNSIEYWDMLSDYYPSCEIHTSRVKFEIILVGCYFCNMLGIWPNKLWFRLL